MRKKPHHGPELTRAIALGGGRAALGRKLARQMGLKRPISRHAIYEWGWTAPPKYCLALEAVTGVTRYQLRPDIYGPEPTPARPKRAAAQAAA